MLLIAVPVGLLIGMLLGALGGGGSLLAVPALVYLLHQQPHAATTAALVVVGLSALSGLVLHLRAGRVAVAAGAVFGVLGVAGSWLGTTASANVDPDVLLTAFAALILLAGAAMVRRRPEQPAAMGTADGATGADAGAAHGLEALATATAGAPSRSVAGPGPERRERESRGLTSRPAAGVPAVRPATGVGIHKDPRSLATLVGTASGVGFLVGFFGVGGGFVVVPALTLALGFEMPVAVGTSLLVIAINVASSLAARVGTHVAVDWPMVLTFAAAAMGGSMLGNRVTARLSPRALSVAFAVLCVVLAGYIWARSIPPLIAS